MSFYIMQIFTFMVRIGYQASITVFFILLARAFFNWIRMPKRYSCLLWWIPFLRLALPIKLKSVFSLLPNPADPVSIGLTVRDQPVIYIDSTKIDSIINTSASVVLSQRASLSEFRFTCLKVKLFVFAAIWGIGVLFFFGYGIYSIIRLRYRLRISIRESEQIYLVDHIPTAFVMGICPARIYLPSNLSDKRKEYVISHEQQHIKRKDHIVKVIFFFLTCFYWIYPLIWVAYYLANKDIEFACDEAVIQSKSFSYRQRYAAALLEESSNKRFFTMPLAFSKGSPKKRIQYIISYKKPWVFVTVAGIVGMLVLSAALLTDPVIEATEEETAITEQTTRDPIASSLTEQTAYLIDQKIEQVNQNDQIDSIEEQMEYFINSAKEQVDGESEFTFELKAPQIDLTAAIGSDILRLYYVDKNQIIFGGNFWVFVYSKEEETIIRGIDLEAIGCSAIPQERYCEIEASSDGATLYFHPIYISSDGTKTRVHPARSMEWLIYSISDHTLTSEKHYHISQEFLYHGITEDGKKAAYRANGEEKSCMLSYSDTIGSLSWLEDNNYHFFFSQED